MKILVTGARGMLGADLCRELNKEGFSVFAHGRDTLDITDPTMTRSVIQGEKPDVVMHLAANTNLDYCEEHSDEAYRTNAVGTQNVALACRAAQSVLVYLSSDAVFDGKKGKAYTEFDRPNPLNEYGKAKLAGEYFVKNILPQHFIVRAGWMFGGGPKDKKFVAKIIDMAKGGKQLKGVTDKRGSPIYTLDLAKGLIRLIQTNQYGTYHLVNQGDCSRFEFAQHIISCAGFDAEKVSVKPIVSSEFPLPATRPDCSPLDMTMHRLLGWELLRDWKAAVRAYVNVLMGREQR